MSDKVYKKIRVVGCSAEGFDQAVTLAVSKASESLHGISWFEVVEFRGAVKDGKPVEWQATVDVGFKLD
jgi:flavin-binding protein dodecin